MAATELILCMSQEDVQVSYRFKITNINVYSFEEAVYHCYYYWKQSVDDFVSDEFLNWVADTLGLSFLASKIREISRIQNFSDKLFGFLSLADYFDQVQLAKLKSQLTIWEKRMEWEHLKERGDYLMQKGEPSKAYFYYKKALLHDENRELHNNISIALMQLGRFPEAMESLEKALVFEPDSLQLILNYAEVLIYNHDFEKALRTLKLAEEKEKGNADIQYLYGELNYEAGNVRYSIDYFERALAIKYEAFYIYRLVDVYIKLRSFDKALQILEGVEFKDKQFLLKQAEVYEVYNNVPAAIKCIERAIILDKDSVHLWTKLAMYHRLDYDLGKADSAITRALSIDSENEKAQLESARIKKAQGKIKDYQVILNNILLGFKRNYREHMS